RVVVDLTDLDVAERVAGRRLQDGRIRVTVADGVADIAGTARMNGVVADIAVRKPLDGQGGQSTVRLAPDDAGRAALGLALDEFVGGTIHVTLDVEGNGEVQRGEADLTDARLAIDPLGWEKPRGTPARARFVIRPTANGGTIVEDIALTTGNTRIEGAVR